MTLQNKLYLIIYLIKNSKASHKNIKDKNLRNIEYNFMFLKIKKQFNYFFIIFLFFYFCILEFYEFLFFCIFLKFLNFEKFTMFSFFNNIALFIYYTFIELIYRVFIYFTLS